MVLSVCDVELVTVEGHSLWSKETGVRERSAHHPVRAGTDDIEERSIEFGNNNPVMIGISDEQPVILFVSENFARERERQIADFGLFQHQLQRSFIQFAALSK